MNQPSLWVIGLNHQTAPLDIREKFALSGEQLDDALRRCSALVSESVILSTCNRLELYAVIPDSASPDSMFGSVFGDEAAPLHDYIYRYKGKAASKHLFRVASGIDSLVLGEVQVLGQVQRAWQAAHNANAVGPILSQLFHKGVALGKRVQSETSISRQPASVSYAAVVLARRIFGPQLDRREVLVIGTGEVGEGVARCLHDYGVRPIVVSHRQIEQAGAIARRYDAATATWDELPRRLAETDIVISSTAAPHYILRRQQIEDAIGQRAGRPLYLIDLAVPRDIDPTVAELEDVYLHNVDDLQAVVSSTLAERQMAVPEIEAMVEVETARFADWLRARMVAPTIKELSEQSSEISHRELAWAMARLPELTERERQVVEALADRLVGKLLHGPIQWLKAQAEASAREEPDYGIARLSAKELSELFYVGEAMSDDGRQATDDGVKRKT